MGSQELGPDRESALGMEQKVISGDSGGPGRGATEAAIKKGINKGIKKLGKGLMEDDARFVVGCNGDACQAA